MENYVYRHVGKLCDVEDLVIQGRGATPHPIHIHVNHFQVAVFVWNPIILLLDDAIVFHY
jgi:hypothetical protein